MSERDDQELSADYPKEEVEGTTVADTRHVSVDEAKAAANIGEVEEELPEADPDFDDDDPGI